MSALQLSFFLFALTGRHVQICVVCYYVWIIWLPKIGGYTIVEEVQNLPDGACVTRLRRKYLIEGGESDECHTS